MWQVTWINHHLPGKPVGAITTPSRRTAAMLYGLMRRAGWRARIWNPKKELVA